MAAQTASADTASSTMPSTTVLIVIAFVAGFFVVPYAARFAPRFVNGLLLIILLGAIVGNMDRWLPWFTGAFGGATSSIKR
jgi:Na+/citrate or Na+/malate symporter